MSDRVTYRMKFVKKGRLRFIGHLDLLNVFQRAMKRGHLPIAYSQGFNPHQEISFAMPLTLGYESEGEYLDAIFSQTMDTDAIQSALNGALPQGLSVICLRTLRPGEKNSAGVVRAARYEVLLPEGTGLKEDTLTKLLRQEEILIEKTTKKKTATVNIKPMIYELSLSGNRVDMLIAAGSKDNLKAESLVRLLYTMTEENKEYEPYKVQYKRIEMYSGEGPGRFIPLYQ